VSLSPASGLPERICNEWDRVSFSKFPVELAHLREPKSKPAAETAADALITFLKNQLSLGRLKLHYEDVTIGEWLKRFISLVNNPRSARLISDGIPYSTDTIEGYRQKYEQYLKDDPFMKIKMAEADESDALSFNGRLGLMKNKKNESIAGTRTYEITSRFVRMAFHEYEEENHGWYNPFRNIKAPKSRKPKARGAITDHELANLFKPEVFTDPLQKAICAAMFYAGIRRSEIFALKPENLDWHTPRINITNAWKRFTSKKHKEIGDPKWHKIRDTIFPNQLQEAIKELWESYGKHEYVFCYKDGTSPGSGYLKYWVPRWFKKAGINTEGRNLVPHGARHSLASILEADGVPLRYIQKMLGHSKMETTLGYLHEPADTMNKISDRISQKN
jgi:integrase